MTSKLLFAARKSVMQKVTLKSCGVQYTPAAILYFTFLDRILRSYYLVCFLFIVLLVAPLSHKHGRPSTVFAIYLLPPQRKTITTGMGSIAPLDELKLLLSNIGSLQMASLS